ncbi:MAG: acyltransferase family protein [Cyanobacteriota bacterium]
MPMEARPSYRPEIDGLRALAILVVIINHTRKEILPSGYLGVDIFFVISGFVITSSLSSYESTGISDFLLGFYSRRLKRLVPALALFIGVISVLLCFVNPDPGVMLGLGRRALFGVSNIQLFREATNYFSTSTELNPFTHTWSLGVEEQFYLLFPLLVWVAGYGRFREGQRVRASGSRNLFWVIVSLSIASLLAFCLLYQSNQPAAYFLMPPRLWELGSGCLVFLGLRSGNAFVTLAKRSPSWPILLALIGVMFAPLSLAVPATFAAVVLTGWLMASLEKGTLTYRLFTLSPVIYIGKISYSLYLWHWGVLSLGRWSIGVQGWSVPLLLLLMLALASASYHYLETPLRYAQWSRFRWKTIAYGLLATVLAAMGTIFVGRRHAGLFAGKFKADDFVYIQRDMGCEMLSPNPVRDWKTCLQRNGDEPHIFVLGDSHSSNLVPSLKEAGRSHGLSSIRYLSNALKGRYNSYDSRNDSATRFWDESVTYREFEADLRPGDLVVYSHMYAPGDNLEPVRRHVAMLTKSVSQSGASLLLVDDIPKPCSEEEFARGFLLNPGKGCGISKSVAIERRGPLTAFLKSQVKENVSYLDPVDSLCEGESCYPTRLGKILYADPSPHFSIKNPAPLRRFFENYFSGRSGRKSS